MEESLSTNRNERKAKIRAALAGQTTGLTAGEIRERGGMQMDGGMMSALMSMQALGEVIKHPGETPRTSRYSLNPEQLTDAPQRRKATKKKKPGRKPGKKRQARRPAAPIVLAAAPTFIPALTVESELVLVFSDQPHLRFTPEQTVAIATLLAANFG